MSSEKIVSPVQFYGYKGTNTAADNKVFLERRGFLGGVWAFAKRVFLRDGVEYSENINCRQRINPVTGVVDDEVLIDAIGVLVQNPLPNTAVPLMFMRTTYNLESGHENDAPNIDFVFLDELFFEENEIRSYKIAGGVARFAARGIDLPPNESVYASFNDFVADFYAEGFESAGGYLALNSDALYFSEFDEEENRDITFSLELPDENMRP